MSNSRSGQTLAQRAQVIVEALPEVLYSREFSREYQELGLIREDRPKVRIRHNSLEEACQEFYDQEYN